MPGTEIPAAFHGGLITVHARTRGGVPLVFDMDSGGAMLLSPEALRRVGGAAREEVADWGEVISVVELEFDPNLRVPPPARPFMVRELPPTIQGDGMLGQQWHADRVWTYDYLAGRLWAGDARGHDPLCGRGHSVALGLPPPGDDGRRPHAFASMEVSIDGESAVFLFDTGARVELTPAAQAVMGADGPALRATCFVVESLFQQWRTRHRDWPYIAAGDGLLAGSLLGVPAVEVAGHRVGPVWFTSRPDANFDVWTFMDRPIRGALGGDLFRHFARVVADYQTGRLTLIA